MSLRFMFLFFRLVVVLLIFGGASCSGERDGIISDLGVLIWDLLDLRLRRRALLRVSRTLEL